MSTWKDLHDDGVRMLVDGDLAGARETLEAALAAAPTADRAQCLLNLAHVVDLTGDRQHAVDLMTEALPLAQGPLRALVVAARADLLPWLGRWDEAWQDVEAALVDAEPGRQVVLRNTRVALLMMAGRLAEAEEDATATVELAAAHAPEYLENLHTNLAILAEEAGDDRRAAMHRLLSDNPGRLPVGPRWHRCVELNAQGIVLAGEGDRAGAVAAYEAAYRETDGADGGVDDVEAMACRAAVASNLADVVEDHDEVVRWSTEAVTTARAVLAAAGDAHGSALALTTALVARAVAHHARTRLPEALADLDDAVEVLTQVGSEPVEATVRATRARVLAVLGRYAEAADEARTALDLSYAAAPTLVAMIHATLAEIASGTGDVSGAVDHLAVVRDLCAATGDVQGEASAVFSAARLAYLAADADRADTLYQEAEGLRATDTRWRALCAAGRAAVATLRGHPREALASLDRARALLGPSATPLELVGIDQLRGSAFEALGEFAAADASFAEASARCDAAGMWHVALGMTWWRADALVRRAVSVTGDERRAYAERALDLALPAALASEAVRQRFPHGPLRERWVALASAPAIRTAFLAIRAVEDTALAVEYIDHLAGAVSLRAEGGTAVAREELVTLPEPPPAEPHLPYAAGGFGVDPGVPVEGLALPPRVRFDPAVRSTLDGWLDVAEERYGFPVRSAGAVAAW